jgi:hypothetical protein
MAAGVIYQTVTTTGSETVELGFYVDETGAPTTWTNETHLAAGTNAIGKLAANSGVDIGDVDVTSVIPGTGATNLGKAEDAIHSSGDTGVMALGVRQTTQTSFAADGDYAPVSIDDDGGVRVTLTTNSPGVVALGQAVMAASLPVVWASDMVGTAGPMKKEDVAFAGGDAGIAMMAVEQTTPANTCVSNAEYGMLQMQRGRLWTSGGLADDAAFTVATDNVAMAGFFADETATDSVDEGDGGAARMTLDRKVIVTPQPHTAGGLTVIRKVDLDETPTVVKASAGQIYGYHASNRTTSPLYLRFYNIAAASVTVGTSSIAMGPLEIPANASDHTIMMQSFGGHGIAFDTAISMAVTTGFADADTAAPAANACMINVFIK